MNGNEIIKKVKENLDKSNVKNLFADEVIIMSSIKSSKIEEKIKKEGFIRLVFVDMLNQKPISSITISLTTAIGLINALQQQIQKIKKDLEIEESREGYQSYIG